MFVGAQDPLWAAIEQGSCAEQHNTRPGSGTWPWAAKESPTQVQTPVATWPQDAPALCKIVHVKSLCLPDPHKGRKTKHNKIKQSRVRGLWKEGEKQKAKEHKHFKGKINKKLKPQN